MSADIIEFANDTIVSSLILVSQDLMWEANAECTAKAAKKNTYFMYQLRKYNSPQDLLANSTVTGKSQ